MRLHAIRWCVPPLSTPDVEAALRYGDGVAALVAGIDTAATHLTAAVATDPDFILAHVALAVSRFVDGAPYVPPPLPSHGLGRAERHHAEIVGATLAGERRHAADLRREHLAEFPGDLLIVWLPALCRRSGP